MLVVFDVDGTLTKTDAIDGELFAQALVETHGISMRPEELNSCRFVSDRGVAEEVLERHFRRATPNQLSLLHDHFLKLLDKSLPLRDERLQVQGAASIIELLTSEGYGVAIATGCWRASALLKLERAAIGIDGIPLATCDDHPARETILRLAIERAGGSLRFDRVVYIGDGPWDVIATRRLGVPFVGIDYNRRDRLRGLSAGEILTDFMDTEAFLRAIARAEAPGA